MCKSVDDDDFIYTKTGNWYVSTPKYMVYIKCN